MTSRLARYTCRSAVCAINRAKPGLRAAMWFVLILCRAFWMAAVCVQTTTPAGHAAIALTDPTGEQTATFDLVWGGMLGSLTYRGAEQLYGSHTAAMVQPNLYAFFNGNQYDPWGAGDYALRGSTVPGVYCTTADKLFILTGMTDFAAGASGHTPLNAIQDGAVVPGKYAVPYTLRTVARFVPNPTGQPAYYLKLESQIANNHPSEWLAFGFWLVGTIPYDHGNLAVSPQACQDANCDSSQTPYLVGGGYVDAGLSNGVAFYVSPQAHWNVAGSQAFVTFRSSAGQYRSTNLVNRSWSVPPLAVRNWSWYVLAGGWTAAVAFGQAGGPDYQGNLDGVDCQIIAGWAWDGSKPNTPINVDVYDGGALIGTVSANQFRGDLVNAGIGNGYHGFSFNTPASVRDGQVHSIRVSVSGTVVGVANSPRTTACPAEKFYTVAPCRVMDTRKPADQYGGPSLGANMVRTLTLAGQCGIPSGARAVAINLTTTGATAAGSLTVYPGNIPQAPGAATNSYGAGQTRACEAVVGLDPDGRLAIVANQPTGVVDCIVDVSGYFE